MSSNLQQTSKYWHFKISPLDRSHLLLSAASSLLRSVGPHGSHLLHCGIKSNQPTPNRGGVQNHSVKEFTIGADQSLLECGKESPISSNSMFLSYKTSPVPLRMRNDANCTESSDSVNI